MANAVQFRFPKFDKRLPGAWKSDKKRTFAEWNWKRNTSPDKRAKIKSLFGNLEITYTRSKVHSKLPHRKFAYARRYVILGVDDESVAIAEFGEMEIANRKKYDPVNLEILKEFCSKTKIKHIHFDKKHYWVSLGNGKNREFFRKIRDGK